MTGTLQVGTTGTISGLQNNQQINTIAGNLADDNAGGTAPTSALTGLASTSGVKWHDTANNQLKLRDQADSTWMPWATVDETNKLVLLLLRSYLAGLTLSNDTGTPNTKLDVAAGICADDTNVAMISLPSGGVIDCTTVGANGLDTGTPAASTWYHVFAISKAGGVSPALLVSTSVSAPVFPSGYTLKRRIGSIRTDASAHILAFVQNGDYFAWSTPVRDASITNPGNSAALRTLTIPTGVIVEAFGAASIEDTAGVAGVSHLISDPATNAPIVSTSIGTIVAGASGDQVAAMWRVPSNSSAQVRSQCSGATANTVISIDTFGWWDRRGRDK